MASGRSLPVGHDVAELHGPASAAVACRPARTRSGRRRWRTRPNRAAGSPSSSRARASRRRAAPRRRARARGRGGARLRSSWPRRWGGPCASPTPTGSTSRRRGETKLDLVHYYLAVGDGHRQRPAGAAVHAAPLPDRGRAARRSTRSGCRPGAPPWLETVRVHFPRYGLHADELCVTELADVIWAVQMSTVEFHPWNSRRADVEKPDEWRIDLDPMPDCPTAPPCAAWPTSSTRCSTSSARSAGRRRRAAGGCTSTCASSRLRVRRRAPGRAGLRPRGRATGAGRRHHDVVAQGP